MKAFGVLMLGFSLALVVACYTPAPAPAPLAYVTVDRGQNLWTMSQRFGAPSDPREWVFEVRRANGWGPGHVLRTGETILVPDLRQRAEGGRR